MNLLQTRQDRKKELLVYSPGAALVFLGSEKINNRMDITVAVVRPSLHGIQIVHERGIWRAAHTVERFRL